MKNFEITAQENGKKYWISRAIAVSSFVFLVEDDIISVLANKRGPGTPDFQGCWNAPCGYLDFDETAKEAALREIKEETGITFNEEFLQMIELVDDPKENRQNVTIRFAAVLSSSDIKKVEAEGGEEDEVSEVAWISEDELDNYEWAFNHLRIIKDFMYYLNQVRKNM